MLPVTDDVSTGGVPSSRYILLSSFSHDEKNARRKVGSNSLKTIFFIFYNCDKPDDLPFYGTGTAPVLTASATTVTPQPADSNNVALTLNWSNPQQATDSGKAQ